MDEHITSRVHNQHKAPLMPDGERGIYTLKRHFNRLCPHVIAQERSKIPLDGKSVIRMQSCGFRGNSSSMFLDCKKIKGGQGTTYDPNHTDAAYAHVDGGNRVTSKNKDNIGVNEGTASFDPSTQTLTLNNVYVYADRDDGILSGTASMEGMLDFKIVCNGTNEVESTDFVGLTQYGAAARSRAAS